MNRERRIDPSDWDEAVADSDGPQLIVAGPGTGKTEFIVRRAVHLLDERAVPSEAVAVLTFSRRAAADLRDRISRALTRSTTLVPVSTYHSLAHRLLERYAADHLGWAELPSLLTGPEQVDLVGDLLQSEDPRRWPVPFRPLLTSATFAEEAADFILRTREHLLDDQALRRLAAGRDDWRALPDFAARYTDELRRRNRIDYGSLQAAAIELLAGTPAGTEIAERYRYVLIDEYQDTTAAQSELLRLLYTRHRNLTVVADPYQSVYSFRGAEVTNVVEFPGRFPAIDGSEARRLVLTTSFRVPGEILDAAVRVTAGGGLPGGAGPVLPAPHRGRVDVRRFQQQSEEADWIAAEAERLHIQELVPYRSMAVLVRTKRRLLAELSRALERRSIPHDPPDARLVDHPAARLVFDVVTAATACHGSADRAVRRLLLGPLFALPLGVERDAYRRRLRTGESWATIIRDDIEEGDALADLLDDASWATDQSAADGFWTLWTRLPQFDRFIEGSANSAFRAAWASLMQALTRQEERDPTISLARYAELADREDFEATPLLRFRDDSGDRLTLTTLHQAKGLEFDVVFIADAVEGVFPDLRRQRSLLQTRLLSPHQDTDPASARTFRLQEEMRLAYTAMTRARRRVVWTATDAGIDEGERRPSRFLGALGVEPTTGTSSDAPPITPLEAEAYLRRALVDPGRANGLRLAAAHLLVARPNPAVRPVDEFALVRSRGSDRGLVGEDLRLSPSQAEAYVSCPRRYALERRLDAAGESGPYAGFGSLIHDVLEETEKAAAERGDTHGTLDEALRALDRHFETADFGASGWRTAWKKRAERLLRGLYLDWIRPEARPVLLEHTLELELDGVLWRGRADRIELTPAGTTRIVDYKTTTSPKPRKEAASSIQLGFYLMAARRDPVAASFGEPAEAEFWYPLAGSKHVPFDPATLPLVEEAMRTVAAGIRAEDWTPTVSGDCERCPVRIVCPEWPEGRESFSR